MGDASVDRSSGAAESGRLAPGRSSGNAAPGGQALVGASVGGDRSPSGAAEALDGGLAGLHQAYAAGLDPVAVVEEVLARIEAADDPAIWISVEAADDLRTAAKELGPPGPDRPLWGVPFGVKDNIDVAGRPTSAGLPGAVRTATSTATVVARLLAAGAIYVGKTNLDQLATGLVGTRSPYGTPRNPVAPALVPGGSSSGSAVAVARRQVTFALGTDTAGSGRVPAAMCGVVGLKGAPGTRPTDGVVPASPSIDCVSTFAASVADGLAVESVLAGVAWPVASGPFVVGVAAGTPPGVAAALVAAGCTVVEADLGPFHEAGDLLYGGPWLADRTAALATVLDAAPEGLVEVVRTVVAGGTAYSGTEVFAAQARLRDIGAALAPWWAEVDALVVPTVPWLPTVEEVAADPIGANARLGRNTTFANLLGLAAIAVPGAAVADGAPGGVSVLAPRGAVAAVAAVAGLLEGEALPAAWPASVSAPSAPASNVGAGGAGAGAGAPSASVTETSGPASSGAALGLGALASTGGGAGGAVLLAVVGAHLRGQPLNGQLVDAGAALVATTTTSARYRLHHLAGGPVARPGLERVEACGRAIEVEVWALPVAGLGAVTAAVAPPLGIGSVELDDGRWVKGFICEGHGLADATDITSFGSWRRYLASLP